MSTYTQILYQIVFSTKNREQVLIAKNRDNLFKYIAGLIRNKNCLVFQINGVEDHIHIFIHLHPSISLSSLVKDIKLSTTQFIRSTNLFENFIGWQDGYGAFTYNYKEKEAVINYIKNQEVHHKKISYKEELIDLLKRNGVNFDRRYLL